MVKLSSIAAEAEQVDATGYLSPYTVDLLKHIIRRIWCGRKKTVADMYSATPPYTAVESGVVRFLQYGVDPNVWSTWERAPLHYALRHEPAALLLRARTGPNISDYYGITPLHYAVVLRCERKGPLYRLRAVLRRLASAPSC
jgi:ankyrin repeat protein